MIKRGFDRWCVIEAKVIVKTRPRSLVCDRGQGDCQNAASIACVRSRPWPFCGRIQLGHARIHRGLFGNSERSICGRIDYHRAACSPSVVNEPDWAAYPKMERVMGEKFLLSGSRFRNAMLGSAVSLLLAATIMPNANGAPGNGGVQQGTFATMVSNDVPSAPTIETDPTDDGNIIIECVGFVEIPTADSSSRSSNILTASMPRYPIGPSKCSPPDRA
jgi:hypothetical protein